MRFDRVPPRSPDGLGVHVIVDTPAGSANKYKFDEELGLFRISRILSSGLVFPYDFGSIPGTRAADGDALDAVSARGNGGTVWGSTTGWRDSCC
jgi:inorganic pyrophosphatase